MKNFQKLIKERGQTDNKSFNRMKAFKSSDTSEIDSKVKIYAAPQSKKTLKKSKRALNSVSDKHMYHKRVKSDQIYNVKLLLRGDDKAKNIKNKHAVHQKQISLSRPTTNKHESINSGYSQFAFKKSKDIQNSLLSTNSNNSKNNLNFRSENCTPKKLGGLQPTTYKATCFAQIKKSINNVENKNKEASVFDEVCYKKNQGSKGKQTANTSFNIPGSSNDNTTPLFKNKGAKNLSSKGSRLLSPNQQKRNVEKNRRNLCDYQKDKRSQPTSNVVIVMNNKQDKQNKHEQVLSKYLK